jgi:hypothetical protein
MTGQEVEKQQRELCDQHGLIWTAAPDKLKVGIARNVKSVIVPVNGLRHPPKGDTTGWYIWAGEGDPSPDADFFIPLHVEHIQEWRAEILKFLGLPPGWRFLTDGRYEDVWEDPSLLEIS